MKLLIVIGITISSFQVLSVQSGSDADLLSQKTSNLLKFGKFEAAIPLLKNCMQLYFSNKDWENCLNVCEEIDECFYQANLVDEAIAYFEGINQELIPIDIDEVDELKGNCYYFAGYWNQDNGNYEKAIKSFEKGLEYAEKLDVGKLSLIYINLGRLYWESGNHKKAVLFLEKALALPSLASDTSNTAITLQYLGDTYRTMNNPIALDYFRRSIALDPKNVQALIQYSKAYQEFGKLDSAFLMVTKALHFLEPDDLMGKADAYYQMANIYQKKKELPKAISNIEKALIFGFQGYGERDPEFARIKRLAGQLYLDQGNTATAIRHFQDILQSQSSASGIENDPYFTPPAGVYEPGSYWVLGGLAGKGEALRMMGGENNLHKALEAFETGMDYGERMRRSYDDQSKLELNVYLRPVVEGGIEAAFDLAKLTGDSAYYAVAFQYSERQRASVMAEALFDQHIKHVSDIPDSLLVLENELQAAVIDWEKALYYENDPNLKFAYRDSLNDTQLKLSSLKDKFERECPQYFQLKYGYRKKADIQSIIRKMDDDDLLLEYYIGKTALYSFAISKQGFNARRIVAKDSLEAVAKRFRKSVSDWDYVRDSSSEAQSDFLSTAPQLYDWLLKEILDKDKAKRLIIVPDGALAQLPFEALLTKPYKGSWKDLNVPYLLKGHAVSYAFSAESNMNMRDSHQATGSGFAGFGTEYNTATIAAINTDSMSDDPTLLAVRTRGGLAHLPNADDEILSISKLMKGATWVNDEATKANFLKETSRYDIIHLATHGILDGENPMMSRLVFNKTNVGDDNQLLASELYNMKLQAHMAVLSACNTGSGDVAQGEGVMSLARAFAYAGCSSLVASLWSVSDRSTEQLMSLFYQSLGTSLRKDESLQAAKLNYLQTTSADYSLPIYWAGFVLMGETAPLPKSCFRTNFPGGALAGVAGLVVLIGVGFYFRRKSKHRQPI